MGGGEDAKEGSGLRTLLTVSWRPPPRVWVTERWGWSQVARYQCKRYLAPFPHSVLAPCPCRVQMAPSISPPAGFPLDLATLSWPFPLGAPGGGSVHDVGSWRYPVSAQPPTPLVTPVVPGRGF